MRNSEKVNEAEVEAALQLKRQKFFFEAAQHGFVVPAAMKDFLEATFTAGFMDGILYATDMVRSAETRKNIRGFHS